MNQIDKSFKYIFLVEGVFDSIFVKNGVACGSLTISSQQMKSLQPYIESGYKIVYLMDNQWADESSMNKSIELSQRDIYANIFIWPEALSKYKDVNETIIASDECIKLWSSEKFLTKNIDHGPVVRLKLKQTKFL